MKLLLLLGLPLTLSGCAAQMLNAAQNECAAFGYAPSTDVFSDCVRQRYVERQQAFQRASQNLSNVGAQMQRNADAPDQQISGAAFLKGQSVQGTSRICVYDRMGSPYVITLNSVDSCPLSQ